MKNYWVRIEKIDFPTPPQAMLRTQAIQVHAWILPRVRPQPLRFTSFKIQYSLIILDLGEIWPE